MDIKEYTSDGDYNLPDLNSNVRRKDKTSVQILKNPDSATITFGAKDSDGAFVAYEEGAISTDDVLNHGEGALLMVRLSGISTLVEIGLSN